MMHSDSGKLSSKLSHLLIGLPGLLRRTGEDPWIRGIQLDSRLVKPGDLFTALSGGVSDGHRFIPDALGRGAAAVVGQQQLESLPVPYIQVRDARLALAYLAASFHGFPAHHLTMIGVTGTDGKTTTSNLIYHILQGSGLKTGMISTVNALIGNQVLDTGFHVTTPEAPDVQAYLSQMVAAELTHVVLEATSHGLHQRRTAFCDFDMAVVTNITHEHLDYHGTYEAYQAAKGLLFESLAQTPEKETRPARGAVLNRDDRSFDYLAQVTRVPYLTYGFSQNADVAAVGVEIRRGGIRFTAVGRDLDGERFHLPLESSLEGEYNVYNCLAAATLALGVMKLDGEAVQTGLKKMVSIPGRMERINLGQEFDAIVDFAHTPNALRRSLEAARSLTGGRLIAVFGSAGLRDREKRRLMAETSARIADLTILTAEDPRTESLAAILQEMAAGASSAGAVEGQSFWRVADRREAIRFAVRLAEPGDLIISCGKGHEQSMCFGEIEYAWDDREAMRAALAEVLKLPGPHMPYLPDPADSG